MSVKRPLKINGTYHIVETAEASTLRPKIVGYRCRVVMQLADDSLPRHFVAAEVVMLGGPCVGERLLLQGVRLRFYTDERETCGCRAYSFPHRRGSGGCYAKDDGPFCGECGKSTEALYRRADPEEKRSLNDDVRWISKCCQGEVFEDPELKNHYSERD